MWAVFTLALVFKSLEMSQPGLCCLSQMMPAQRQIRCSQERGFMPGRRGEERARWRLDQSLPRSLGPEMEMGTAHRVQCQDWLPGPSANSDVPHQCLEKEAQGGLWAVSKYFSKGYLEQN